MIEFRGELTGNSRKFILSVQRNSGLIILSIVATLFSIPIVLAAIYWDMKALWTIFLPWTIVVASLIPVGQENFMPKLIFLDLEEGTIVHQCEKMV